MAEDEDLHEGVEERVRDLQSPESAVLEVGEEYAGIFAAMEDYYMADRFGRRVPLHGLPVCAV